MNLTSHWGLKVKSAAESHQRSVTFQSQVLDESTPARELKPPQRLVELKTG
ncbi:MAG: hypothetical protein ACREB3_01735 [Burkholderiales bacterium]